MSRKTLIVWSKRVASSSSREEWLTNSLTLDFFVLTLGFFVVIVSTRARKT
jgi:hypothetical protein